MRTEAGKMPESLISPIRNGHGVSNDRFGFKEIPVLVAHNAAFDIGCICYALELYGMKKPEVSYYCSLRAARKLYPKSQHASRLAEGVAGYVEA